MTQAGRSKLNVPTWTVTTVAGLCAFMTFWTLLLPGNWTSGFRPNHMRTLDYLSDLASHYIPVPDNMFSKYKGQTAVVLLHHLPSAVWAVAMPLQLSTQLRIKNRQVHRWMGWAASVCGFLLIVGFGLMAKKGLGGNFAMYAVSMWFLYTLCMGVATARQKKYMQHRVWMLRHVGSGIWVVVLRVFVVLAGIAAKVGGYDWWTAGEAARLVGFLICNVAAIALSVGVVEVMVWREHMPQREKVVVKSPEGPLTKEE